MNGVRRSSIVTFAIFLLLVSAFSLVSYAEQSTTQSNGASATNDGILNQYQSVKPLNTTTPVPYNPNATSSHAPGGSGTIQVNPANTYRTGGIQPLTSSSCSLVQDNYNAATSTYVSSLSAAFGSSVSSGEILVAMINDEAGPTSNGFTVSDTLSNTWTSAVSRNDGTITVSAIYYATASSSGSDTVTVSFSSSTRYAVLSVWEISGCTTSNLVTSSGSGDGGPFSVTSVNIASNSFALAGAAVDSAGTWSGTSGFTLTTGTDWGFEYTTSPPSSTTASMSAGSGATWWSEVFIAFPPSSSGSGSSLIGIVQGKYTYTGSSSVSSLSVTMNNPVTDGNILVAMVNDEAGPPSNTITLSDSKGNSWTSAVVQNDGTITESGAYYAVITSTGGIDTITASFSSSTRYAVLSVWEISGYTPLDLVYSSGSGSSGCCSVTQKTISPYSFVLAGAAVDSAGSWTGTSGFTLKTGTDWGFEYTTVPPSSTTASMSASGSTYWSEIMIGFVYPIPEVLHTFNFTSTTSETTASPFPDLANDTNGSVISGFSVNSTCGSISEGTFSDPYCLSVSTGYVNSEKYVQLLWIDNSSLCCDNPHTYDYPNGNTTVTITLVPNGTEAVSSMGVVFQPAKGNGVGLGDDFFQNFGTLLYQSIYNASSETASEASIYIGSTNQSLNTLGENYKTISFALNDLGYYLYNSTTCNSCLTSGIANVQVPHLQLLVTTLAFTFTPQCAFALAVAGLTVVDLVLDPPSGVIEIVFTVAHTSYDAFDVGSECLTITDP